MCAVGDCGSSSKLSVGRILPYRQDCSTTSAADPDLLRCRELESRSQCLRGFLLTFALVRYLLDSLPGHFFQKGDLSPVVVCTQLRFQQMLLGLIQLHAQVVERPFCMFLRRRNVMRNQVCKPPYHNEALLSSGALQLVSKRKSRHCQATTESDFQLDTVYQTSMQYL